MAANPARCRLAPVAYASLLLYVAAAPRSSDDAGYIRHSEENTRRQRAVDLGVRQPAIQLVGR